MLVKPTVLVCRGLSSCLCCIAHQKRCAQVLAWPIQSYYYVSTPAGIFTSYLFLKLGRVFTGLDDQTFADDFFRLRFIFGCQIKAHFLNVDGGALHG